MGSEKPEVIKYRKRPERKKLNKRTVESLTLPPPESDGKPGRAWTYDTATPRLAICAWSSGGKTWYWVGRVNGRMMRMKLGEYPEITPEQARKLAAKHSAEVVQGRDPRQERRERREELTLGELFAAYLDGHAKQHKRSWEVDEALYRRYLASWSSRRLSQVARSEVVAHHGRIGREHGHYAANRMLSLLSTMFTWSVNVGYEGLNPCRGVRRFKEQSRDRFLQAEELGRFFSALDRESDTMRDYFRVSLLTGARKGNLEAMRWDELNLDRGEWRVTETKNGVPQTVYLCPAAVEILRERLAGARSEFVFPARRGNTAHVVFPYAAWKRVCKRAGLVGLRPHDLRRSLASWQVATGASLPVVSKTLGHLDASTTAIYARLDLNPVRAAVDNAVQAMLAAAGKPPQS
jgi:integrase